VKCFVLRLFVLTKSLSYVEGKNPRSELHRESPGCQQQRAQLQCQWQWHFFDGPGLGVAAPSLTSSGLVESRRRQSLLVVAMALHHRVVVLGALGFLVSLYALHVESELANELVEDYQPMCVTQYGSCTAVFSSEYAHLLSHWGLVEKGSALDLSLATLGAFNYGLYALFPFWPLGRSAAATALLAISLASCGFSVYLLYVLKMILKDFCIVCTTFHAINFSMLFFAARPIYAGRRARAKAA